jgi:mRNA interferase MazF
VIVQDDRFDANDSIVVCPLTTDPTQASIFRLSVQLGARSGLRAPCRMMVDKLTAVPRKRLGKLVGSLASEEVKALNRAIFVFLGLAETEAPQDQSMSFTPSLGAPPVPGQSSPSRSRSNIVSGQSHI